MTDTKPRPLIERLDNELACIAHEVMHAERHGKKLASKNPLAGVDIYGSPEALMHYRRGLEPFVDFKMMSRTDMPPNAIGQHRGIWVFCDNELSDDALIIRRNGVVYGSVRIKP